MNRRIALATLLFMVVAILLFISVASGIDQHNRRQALAASCRLFAVMAQQGMDGEELVRLAKAEGYILSIREASDPPVPFFDGVSAPFGQQGDEVVLAREGDNFFFGERATQLRWLSFGALVAAALLSAALSRVITRPVVEFTKAIKELMQGHYGIRVSVRDGGEVGALAGHFNAMAAQVQQTIEMLNHNSAEMESIINAMRSGLIAVDEQMHVIRLNPIAKRMFEVHGDPYGKYVLDVTRSAKLEGHLAAAMEQGDMYTAELATRIEKENRILRLYITGLVRNNESIGAVALIEDVTQLKRLENMRVDFVANVTHELKTPLTSIRGFVETLQGGALNDHDSAMRFLSIISMEVERLTRLIDDILSLSSLESGRRREETAEPMSFAYYARQICELLQSTARDKNIELKMQDDSKDAFVMGSEDKIKQVLINLVDNAIKYTPDNGHVLMKLSIEGDYLVFCVQDDGIGIEEEHVPRLFERFYRVDKGRSRSMGGTGLGLAIVKHIAKEMDGTIGVESKVGEGTTFMLRLPIAKDMQFGQTV